VAGIRRRIRLGSCFWTPSFFPTSHHAVQVFSLSRFSAPPAQCSELPPFRTSFTRSVPPGRVSSSRFSVSARRRLRSISAPALDFDSWSGSLVQSIATGSLWFVLVLAPVCESSTAVSVSSCLGFLRRQSRDSSRYPLPSTSRAAGHRVSGSCFDFAATVFLESGSSQTLPVLRWFFSVLLRFSTASLGLSASRFCVLWFWVDFGI
jgi:hypothetical protein